MRHPYALAAEFDTPQALESAAQALRAAGFTRLECYSPMPLDTDSAAAARSRLPRLALAGGITGFLAAVGLELVPTAVLYPLDIMGKPVGPLSAPAFFPIAFELTILFAALFSFFGFFALAGLPRLHHPIFAWDRFRAASDDRFFCVVETADPQFSESRLREILAAAGGHHITLVKEEG